MVTIGSLWLAILLSAVLVLIASAFVWMALPHHKNEYARLPDEERVRDVLSGTAPGLYSLPHAASADSMKDPEFLARLKEGPVAFLTVVPSGVPAMGGNIGKSFIYYLVVSFMVAYLAHAFLEPGMPYLQVFRFTAVTAWLAYGFGVVPYSIWFGHPWSSSAKYLLDALLFGLLTGGVFGWLWPTM
jgi:hypothetical protein